MRNTTLRRAVTAVAAAAAFTLTSAVVQAEPPQVLAPSTNSATVKRVIHGPETVKTMDYVVERGTDSIKYEGASTGLGENGVKMTDTFVIRVANAGDSVTVVTKAAKDLATSVSGVGDSHVDDNGFLISLVSIEGEVYTITLRSESASHALSNVTFTFAAGNYAEPSYD